MTDTQPTGELLPKIPDHELAAVIGSGSYGEVWQATNVMGMGRAVKIVRRQQFDSDRPFEREFAALQRYEVVSRAAEGLVAVLHIGRDDPAGLLYYVMELADARPEGQGYAPETLKSKLEAQGHLPAEEVLVLGTRLSQALGMLHEHGLVHRDVKPENIIFVRGQAKLADIGLVTSVQAEAGSQLGTVGYVPPEGQGSPAADLFSLGIVLWQALTGGAAADFPSIQAKWLVSASPMATELLDVTLRAAESDPLARYQTAKELLADLALIQSGQSARHLRGLASRLRWLRRAAWLAAIATAALVVQRFRHGAELAHLAKQTAEEQIAAQRWSSSLLEAVTLRRSGMAGERQQAEALLKTAATAKPLSASEKMRLRDELAGVWSQADLVEQDRHAPNASGGVDVLSPTGQQRAELAASGVRLVGIMHGHEIRILQAAGRRLESIGGYDSTGQHLVALPADGGCVVWAVATGEIKLNWPGPHHCVWAFSADGTTFLHSGFRWGVIREVDLGADPKPDRIDSCFGSFLALEPSPDGKWLAMAQPTAKGLNEIVLWDRTAQKLVRTVVTTDENAAPTKTQPCMAWSPDARRLAICLGNHELWIHQREVGPELPSHLQGHLGVIVAMAWSADGQYLASTDWNGATRLWLAATGREQVLLPESSLDMDWRADSPGLLLRQSTGALSFQLSQPIVSTYATGGPPHGVTFSPDEKWLAADARHGISVLDLTTHLEVARLPAPGVMTPHWTNDGTGIYAINADAVYRWPVTRGSDAKLCIGEKTTIHAPGGTHLVASADGKTLAWASGKDSIEWSVAGAMQPSLGHAGGSDRLVMSPDGHWLTVTHWHGAYNFRYHDLQTQNLYRVPQAAFFNQPEPNGRLLANDAQQGLQRWIATSPTPIPLMPPDRPRSGRAALAISEDGKWIAAQCASDRIALLDATTLQVVIHLEIPGHFFSSGPLTLSSHGSYLAANSWHGFVHVWDLRELRRRLAVLGLDY